MQVSGLLKAEWGGFLKAELISVSGDHVGAIRVRYDEEAYVFYWCGTTKSPKQQNFVRQKSFAKRTRGSRGISHDFRDFADAIAKLCESK